MTYPNTLSVSAAAVNISDGAFSPLYDIVWSVKYEVINWNKTDDYGLCLFLRDSSTALSGEGGGRGIDLGYSGTASVNTNEPDVEVNGMVGGVIGVGLDTHGLFAAETTWPGGRARSGIDDLETNSITMRGGAEDDFEYLNVHYPISAFKLLSNGQKILRARLGNYGRTIFIDYRGVGDTDFINILTEDVNLNILPGTKLTPGVSFVKPLTSTSMSFDIIVDTFHIEGTETEPEVTTEYPEPLLPIECNSVYGGEVILEKPDVNFPIIPPIKDVTMCEVAKNANLTLTVDAPASVQSRGDIITYKIQVENNSSQRAENVIVYNSVTNAERLSATGDTFLFTSGSALSAGSTHSVEFSYIVNGTEGEEHQTTTTVTSLYDEPKSVQTAVPIKLDQFKFKIDTNKGSGRTFVLPLIASGAYDINVDWGDGFNNDITEYNSPDVIHKYNVDGIYTITISGQLSGWQFGNDAHFSKLQYIDTLEWTGLYITTNAAFSGCANYTGKTTAIGAPTISTTDLSYTFAECAQFNGVINNWNISNVENIEYMFTQAYKFNRALSDWNVSSLTTAENFLSGGDDYAFSITAYDKTLLGWYNLSKNVATFPDSVRLDVKQYHKKETAYNQLSNKHSWVINDLGHRD